MDIWTYIKTVYEYIMYRIRHPVVKEELSVIVEKVEYSSDEYDYNNFV